MTLLTNKQVAIIGGGPVGLMTAVLLQQRGAVVTVYERDPGPETRIWGGTLDIHRNSGQRALEAAGLLEQFYQLARPTGERSAATDGTVLEDEPVEEATAYWRPEIDRPDLRRLLLSALAPGTVVWGQHFQGLDEQPDGRFELRFAGQPTQVADVVIGANGGRSRVRGYVTGTEPVYSGSVIIQGEIRAPATACPALYALNNNGNLMVRGERNMFFTHTKADGTLELDVSFRVPAGWMAARGVSGEAPDSVRRLLHEALADWAPLFHEGFEVATDFLVLPLHRLPLVPERAVTRPITLVGDAAHLMPPFAGVGVNTGLLDALHLADALTSGEYADANAAIAAYERTMYDYAHAAQEMTSRAERNMHGEVSDVDLLADRAAWNELL